MGILDVASGAGEGLQQVLRQHMIEEQMRRQQEVANEAKRSNMADESLRGRALDESTAQRKLVAQAQAQTQSNVEANRVRDDVRARYSTLPMRTVIDPATAMRDVATGGVARERFEPGTIPDRQAVDEGVPESLAQNESVIQLRGTPQELAGEERIKLAEQGQANAMERARMADTDRDAARGIAGQRERRLTDWGPPVVQISDPSRPGSVVYTERGSAPGKTAPAPTALRSQEVSSEVGLDQLDRLEKMFEEGGKDLVGPAAGRMRSTGQKLPDMISGNVPGMEYNGQFANLEAATAAFRNATIKAITGAQMNKQEEGRILSQIPGVNDKPNVWRAKARQTRANLGDIANRLAGKRGGTGAGAGTTGVRRFNPATGRLE